MVRDNQICLLMALLFINIAVNNPLLAKEGKRGGFKFISIHQLIEELQIDFIPYYIPINLFILNIQRLTIFCLYPAANIHNI
jgi:hypothetical protein